MAGSIFRHIGENKSKDELRFIERDYGGDLKNKKLDDDYYLELGPEYSPIFNSWFAADERRELIKDLTIDKKKILMK
jgi:hypothetical protein